MASRVTRYLNLVLITVVLTLYKGANCECSPNCINSTCQRHYFGDLECTYGCKDGYFGTSCRIRCPEGCKRCDKIFRDICLACYQSLYGEDCKHNCSDKCLDAQCFQNGTCKYGPKQPPCLDECSTADTDEDTSQHTLTNEPISTPVYKEDITVISQTTDMSNNDRDVRGNLTFLTPVAVGMGTIFIILLIASVYGCINGIRRRCNRRSDFMSGTNQDVHLYDEIEETAVDMHSGQGQPLVRNEPQKSFSINSRTAVIRDNHENSNRFFNEETYATKYLTAVH